ncbi:alpha/beta hydrolase [Catenuloplanes atrovinosus]|uniref:alpha/beta hydrolase n=1 Tax=Catenuloplanes atrovinosus TaxID=137266 RepID=UPI00286A7688|nr:alpha/beta hydrolase [Catenuloplanes atrovinosus]
MAVHQQLGTHRLRAERLRDCATAAIDAYLLTGRVPATGTVCADAPQPFSGRPAQHTDGQQLPPVAPPRPASVLTAR